MGAGGSQDAGGEAAAPAAAPAAPPAAATEKPVEQKSEEKAAQKASPKASPKKQPSPKASPKASPAPAPKPEAPASPSSKLPLPPGEVRAEPAAGEKKGRGKARKDKAEGGSKEAAASNKLCVKNLPDDTTSESLKAMFAAHGTVSEADAKTKEDGKCRGFGFVTMSSADEATKAIAALNNKKVGDKTLMVVVAEKRERTEEKGKGKGKDGSAAKGAGKGKDGKGKGKGKDSTAMQSAQTQQAAAQYNPYTNAAYMQAYYQQYSPYVQQYYNAYGYGYAQQQYMNQQMAYAAASAAAAQPSSQAFQTPHVSSGAGLKAGEYEGSLKSISEKHSYGFIACEETYKKYGRDVYVSLDSLPSGAKVLDRIRFTVKLVEREKTGSDGSKTKRASPTAENVTIVHTTGDRYSQSS